MAAPAGNEFWRLRSKHGRDKIFKTPTIMLEAAYGYFTATDKRKWNKNEGIKGGIYAGDIMQVPTETPYTWEGLCRYLHVHTKFFFDFESDLEGKKDKLSKDFSDVIACIRDIIRQQKLEGAMVGVFSHNIVALELGMVKKVEEGYRGADGKPINPPAPIVLTDMLSNTKKKL